MKQDCVDKEGNWAPIWLGALVAIVVFGLAVGAMIDNEILTEQSFSQVRNRIVALVSESYSQQVSSRVSK